MNPYRATARQKRGAISWTFRRAASSDPRHRLGEDREDEQTFVQGSVVLQVPHHHRRGIALGPGRETAVPGTRGTLPSAIRAMKLAIGTTVSWSRAETACAPTCQTSITP